MSAFEWPASLPQVPRGPGYSQRKRSNVIRTSMDVSVAKARRRATAAVLDFSVDLVLTSDQLDTLNHFFDVVLEDGSESFQWLHPRTRAPAEMRFVAPPESAWTAGLWTVSLSLEVLP